MILWLAWAANIAAAGHPGYLRIHFSSGNTGLALVFQGHLYPATGLIHSVKKYTEELEKRAIVDSRDVLRLALTAGAASIILVHNHPSRDPTPSEDDILLTRRLCLCGGIVEIEVLDHIIIGFSGHVSLKEKGLM